MWSVGVVVLYIADDESFELALVPDDGSVQELASQGSDPAFSEGVGYGGADWCLEDLEAFGSEDLVECVDELAARSRTSARAPVSRSPRRRKRLRLRAAWVVQGPVGLAVMPAKYTSRW